MNPISPLLSAASSPIEIDGSTEGVLDRRVRSRSEVARDEVSWGNPSPIGWKSNDFELIAIGL